MSDETEEPNRRTDPWVGRALSELYGEDGTNPYHLTPAEQDISWAGLMELLDEHWPADLFPTLKDDPERDSGARIVSLLRWVDKGKTRAKDDDIAIKRLAWQVCQIAIQRDEARAALARVEAVCATAIRVRTERMVEGSIVHIAAKDAIDTFAEAIREAAMVDTDEPWLRRLPYRDNPDNRPRMGEDANDFLIRMFEQSKHAAITYPAPDPSQFGISDTIKAFIARGRFKR